jgi:glycosyltransferase involved in cell wall biosynthesis
VRELNLERHIRFLGHRDDVPEVLAASDLFVFPSLYEGLPGAVMEAMALGLPIVAADIEPVRELVEDGRNALLVKAEAPNELATAIERMLADPAAAYSFGRHSRSIFEERFTLGAGIARAAELYRSVAAFGAGGKGGMGRRDGAAAPPMADSLARSPGDKT